MSNKTQLQTNNTELTNLITALQGKAVGGGSVETCTVTLQYTGSYSVATTRLIDNTIVSRDETFSGYTTIDNYVKGALINLPSVSTMSENAELIKATSSLTVVAINGDSIITYNPCFVRNTRILLADGSVKLVQDISYDDLLTVWDFDNGCYATASPLWIKQEQISSGYYRCEFDNGVVLNLVGSGGRCHRVFSVDRNVFESATECVSERVMTKDGIARLLSCERIDEPVEFYNIITKHHLNLYAEGVLTSCRLNNMYPINDMKFVKQERNTIPFSAFTYIDIDFYKGLRLDEQKSEDFSMLNDYVQRLYALQTMK